MKEKNEEKHSKASRNNDGITPAFLICHLFTEHVIVRNAATSTHAATARFPWRSGLLIDGSASYSKGEIE